MDITLGPKSVGRIFNILKGRRTAAKHSQVFQSYGKCPSNWGSASKWLPFKSLYKRGFMVLKPPTHLSPRSWRHPTSAFKTPTRIANVLGLQWLPPLHLCTAPAPGNQTLLRASLGSCLWTRSCLGRSWNIRSETTFDLLSLLCRASRRVCRSFILQKNHPRKLWSVPRHYRHPLQNKLIGITFSGENPVCATTRIITIC